MSKNTIQLGRWLASTADTRLVGCCQVLGLTLLCVVLRHEWRRGHLTRTR